MEKMKVTCGSCGAVSVQPYRDGEVSCPKCGEETVYNLCHMAGACINRNEEKGCEGCGQLWEVDII